MCLLEPVSSAMTKSLFFKRVQQWEKHASYLLEEKRKYMYEASCVGVRNIISKNRTHDIVKSGGDFLSKTYLKSVVVILSCTLSALWSY